MHVDRYPDSLLCRFLCVCELHPEAGKPEMLLCMQNLLTVNNKEKAEVRERASWLCSLAR